MKLRFGLPFALAIAAACNAPREPTPSTGQAKAAARAPSGDFDDYRRSLAERFPANAGEVEDALLRIAGRSGPGVVADEGEYYDVLRTNRERASQLIIEALETSAAVREPGPQRLTLLYALGEVAHSAQIPFLEGRIERCPVESSPPPGGGRPPTQEEHHRSMYGPEQDERLETNFALDAFEKVAVANPSVAVLTRLRRTLDRMIDDRRCHRTAMVQAVMTLMRYADDPRAEREDLERRLGPELAYLTGIELVHEIPGGNHVGDIR